MASALSNGWEDMSSTHREARKMAGTMRRPLSRIAAMEMPAGNQITPMEV
jgi:hypothetical protein